MKKIIIEIVQDKESEGYVAFSDNIGNGLVITQGDDVVSALHNFVNAIDDIVRFKGEDFLE